MRRGGGGWGWQARQGGAAALLAAGGASLPAACPPAPRPVPCTPVHTAYWVIAGNEAHHCTEMGLSAGQGAGFNYMVAPWATWDQLDVKVRLAV